MITVESDLRLPKSESDLELNIAFLASTKVGLFNRQDGTILPAARVLEMGCGRGAMSLCLAPRVKSVVGIDTDGDAIKFAQRKAEEIGITNVTFIQVDAQKLPFPDKTFTDVVSFDVLEHLPDLSGHLRESYRVLEPEGRYSFETPNLFTDALYQLSRLGPDGRRVHTWGSYREVHPSTQLPWQLRKLVKEAGFQLLDLVRMPFQNSVFMGKLEKTRLGMFVPIIKALPLERLPQAFYPMLHGVATKSYSP